MAEDTDTEVVDMGQTGRMARPKKKRVQKSVWIGVDKGLAADIQEAEKRLRRVETEVSVRGASASDADRNLLASLEVELNRLREQAKSESLEFKFQALGRKKYDKLLEAHPPSDEQIEAAKAENINIGFNPETFTYALIDASCVSPEFEEGELAAWLMEDPDDEWNFAEVNELFRAAMEVNVTHGSADLGKGSRPTPSSEPS